MQENTLPAGITQEMVDNAKSAYGVNRVKIAELPMDDDNSEFLSVLVRRPDRSVQGEFMKWADKNPNKADDILVNNCLLSHKEQVKADEGLFQAAVDAIAQLIVTRKARIKNI